MLDKVLSSLRCPHCGSALSRLEPPFIETLSCGSGHTFDVARQGYVSLLAGSAHTDTADTGPMIEARDRFLASGHYRPLSDAVVEAVLSASRLPAGEQGLVVEVGAGTGHYLSHVLDAMPDAAGIALDISKPGLRRAARLDRIAAVAADVWRPLPLSDACASVVLDIFAPRNPAEFARVLAPRGVLVVATPAAEHLHELREHFSLMAVEEDKLEALIERLAGYFHLHSTRAVRSPMRLSHSEVALVVGMGPNAFHRTSEETARVVEGLAPLLEVTLAVDVSVFSPRTP